MNFSNFYIKILMQKTFLKQACTCNQKNTFDDNLLRIEAGGDYHPRPPPDPSSFSCENLKNLKNSFRTICFVGFNSVPNVLK